jgi:(R,R)-butanediol dehydrogenase / meso-butanediol dehydrogenase / diacetyl reductase
MKAVVFHGVRDIRFEENWQDTRPMKPGEVKIAVSWCGICGTDMEDYQHGAVIPIGQPHPASGRMAPLVIGHEFSGRVVELGPDVKGLPIGQKVAIECVRPCKHCYWCLKGEYAACENFVSIGQWDDGGMAEYVIVPAENCIPLTNDIGEDVAALAEPMAVMVRGVRKGRLQAGEVVTIVGAGTIGLCGIAAAKAAGASQVICVAHGGKRAEVAAQVGADNVLNSKEPGWKEMYYDLTHGLGSDLVIDSGGNASAIRQALELTRRGGRCVLNSVLNADVSFPALDILFHEKEIIGTCGHSHDREFAWAVKYILDGRVHLAPLITSRIYLADAVKLGFEKLTMDRSQIKVLVTPHKEWTVQ